VWEWRECLSRSPLGLQLVEWLADPLKHQVVLGRDGYREVVLSLLHRAQHPDCAAAGFEFEPGSTQRGLFNTDELTIQFQHSPGGNHRSVLWSEPEWPGARLWVDAREVRIDAHAPSSYCERSGRWVDERFFAVGVHGPMDHPLQQFPMGAELGAVMGLLIVDAARERQLIVQPQPHEQWDAPWLLVRGDAWCIYPNRAAHERGDAADRVIPFDGATPDASV
jgi:hypothetical protein